MPPVTKSGVVLYGELSAKETAVSDAGPPKITSAGKADSLGEAAANEVAVIETDVAVKLANPGLVDRLGEPAFSGDDSPFGACSIFHWRHHF